MPSPKDGKACTLVPPASPDAAEEADDADPGKVEKLKAEQLKTKTGKYGAVKLPPAKPPATQEEKEAKPSWIEIELKDEEGNPVPGESYRIELPDGSAVEGTLGADGKARVDGIEPGNCKVTFPKVDRNSMSEK